MVTINFRDIKITPIYRRLEVSARWDLLYFFYFYIFYFSSRYMIASCYGKIIRKDCGRTLEQARFFRRPSLILFLFLLVLSINWNYVFWCSFFQAYILNVSVVMVIYYWGDGVVAVRCARWLLERHPSNIKGCMLLKLQNETKWKYKEFMSYFFVLHYFFIKICF